MLYELWAFNLFELHIDCFSQQSTSECIPHKNLNILKCFFREDDSNQLCKIDEFFAIGVPRVCIGKENEKLQY